MSTEIQLNEENCVSLLKRYTDIGYKASKIFSIKDGALLHKYFRVLSKLEEDKELTPQHIYAVIFKAIEQANQAGAYDLDSVAVLDRVMTFVRENVLDEPKETEKIREI